MGLGFLLIPTLMGYWILRNWKKTSYRVRREQGYHVVLLSAFAGLIPAAISYTLVTAISLIAPSCYAIWECFVSFDYSCIMVTVLLGLVSPTVLNCGYSQEQEEQEALQKAREDGNLIELLFADSVKRESLVEISLRNRKSYIGYVLRNATEGLNGADISVVPLWSGYRTEDTQELKITTDYVSALLGDLKEESGFTDSIDEDFRVVFPISEVVSARLFRPSIYKVFRDQETSPLGLEKSSI